MGILAAPTAWVVAEGVGYVVVSRLCDPRLGMARLSTVRIINVIICGVCFAVAAAGLIAALANYRTLHREAALNDNRATFMTVTGIFGSAVFVAAIVLFAMPALIVNVCDQAR